jgi:hypothetical protein
VNAELPDPVPLDMPPGDVAGLTDVVQDVAGAGFHLNVLAGSLTGPAAAAPGWLGDDAAAAVEQVGVAATLARQAAEAVAAAMHRLSAHAECLHEARRRVAALEREQQEDFTATAVRLSQVADAQLAVMTEASVWVGPLDDLRAAEDSRRRRHAAVLEEVAADAAATARVLGDSCAALGGRGAPGDAARVLAHFAARLPGWGDRELALRGRALADSLIEEPLTTEAREALAERFLPYADSPAFATALLAALDVRGVGLLLSAVGYDPRGPRSGVARILAGAFRSAVPGRDEPDGVAAVLTATYVRSDDGDGDADVRAAGMAAVLAAAMSRGRAGVRPETLVEWGRQLLARERVQGVLAGAGSIPAEWDPVTLDPAGLVVALLAGAGDPGPAAALLDRRDAWDVLLARGWADGGASLGELIALACAEPGAAGATATSSGLAALGHGLADNHPDGWTVNRATAAAVAASVAGGVATHVDVAAGALAAPLRAGPNSGAAVLRGLGYLTIHAAATTVVTEALAGWVARQPLDLAAPASVSVPALTVSAAYLGVREYGQRLAYALDAFERMDEAEDRESVWTALVGWQSHIPGAFGEAWGIAESAAARLLGNDGDWSIGPDEGLTFDREDVVEAALEQTRGPESADVAATQQAIAHHAGAAFDRIREELGSPEAPAPPEDGDLVETMIGITGAGVPGRLEDSIKELRRLLE